MNRVGLWILSGHGCAGLCGPRFRWQEEEAEKRASVHSVEEVDEADTLPWSWRDGARDRVVEAYDFCKTSRSNKGKKPLSDIQETSLPFSGVERVLAAVGLPTSPQPARRGVLTGDLFENPEQGASPTEISEKLTNPVPEFSSIIPPVKESAPREPAPSGPLMSLPYPFVGHHGAQVSSEEQVPFPPSPRHPKSVESLKHSQRSRSSRQDSNKENVESDVATNDEAEEGELELEAESDVDIGVEEASDRRTSGSMSSLGHPVPSRYPFQYRRPRGGSSLSSQSRSHITPQSHQSRSTPSRSTQSTGNAETSDSPWSADNSSPRSHDSAGIPMPPRHPNVQQRRGRAGTVPALLATPTPAYHRTRTRTESGSTSGSPYNPSPVYESTQEGDDEEEQRIETPEPEGSIEEAEREDSVGLLSAGPSPRASLIGGMRHWPSSRSRHGSTGSQRSRSPSVSTRSRTQSLVQSLGALSHGSRSRTQSLIQSIGAASQSSLDLARSRAHSIARFSDSPHYSSHSDAIPSSPENNTFGHPIRTDWARRSEPRLPGPHRSTEDVDAISNAGSGSGSGSDSLSQYLSPLPMPTPSNRSRVTSSATHSDAGTIMAPGRVRADSHTAPVPIPGRQQTFLTVPEEHPDLSSVPQSFITAPATVMGSTTTGSEETMPGQTSSGMHPERHFDPTARPL